MDIVQELELLTKAGFKIAITWGVKVCISKPRYLENTSVRERHPWNCKQPFETTLQIAIERAKEKYKV